MELDEWGISPPPLWEYKCDEGPLVHFPVCQKILQEIHPVPAALDGFARLIWVHPPVFGPPGLVYAFPLSPASVLAGALCL